MAVPHSVQHGRMKALMEVKPHSDFTQRQLASLSLLDAHDMSDGSAEGTPKTASSCENGSNAAENATGAFQARLEPPRSPCKRRRRESGGNDSANTTMIGTDTEYPSANTTWIDATQFFVENSSPAPISPSSSLNESRLSQNTTITTSPTGHAPSAPSPRRPIPQQSPGAHRRSPIQPMKLFSCDEEDASSQSASSISITINHCLPHPQQVSWRMPDNSPSRSLNVHQSPSHALTASYPSPLAAHQSIGRFTKDFVWIEKIGEGSFGTVAKVIKKIDLCSYALKSVSIRASLKFHIKEPQAHALLGDNPFVVRYYDCWIENETLYILLELCRESLEMRRGRGLRIAETELIQIAVHVLLGLSYIHESNMAHLDIKPGNIYLSESGLYKIGDLGLISKADSTFDVEEGTNCYLCGHLLQGSLTDLRKADMFSLGATLLELATWTALPSTGPDYAALRNGTFSIPETVNPSLAAVIRLMMHPDPAQRPTCRNILAFEIFAPFSNLTDYPRLCSSVSLSMNSHSSQALAAEREERMRLEEQVQRLRAQSQNVEKLTSELELLRSIVRCSTRPPLHS